MISMERNRNAARVRAMLALQFRIKFFFPFAHVLIIVAIHLSSKNESIKPSVSNKGRITRYVMENVGCATSFGGKR